MKILCVVQRFGPQIVGGAELHCRLIVEHLRSHHDVEVATTCSLDYLTWKNVLPEGTEKIGDLAVHRFPTTQCRPIDFDILAHKVLFGYPSALEEKKYLNAHGPVCPSMIDYLTERMDVDRFILFSYRYWSTWHALKVVGDRSILVPTAEHDRTLHLNIHRSSFHKPRAIAYNSPEERRLIQHVSENQTIPGMTVGVGLADSEPDSSEILKNFDVPRRFFLYIGRIEQAKGCHRLLQDFVTYYQNTVNAPSLVFIGKPEIDIPNHPGIFCLGIQPDSIKLAFLRNSMALVMPSRYESLSMVLLEAWKMRRPVICNGNCDVLRGQCLRSQGGLFYRNTDEFIEVMTLLAERPDVGDIMGTNGERYYQNNYSWSVIMKKYERLLSFQGDIE